MSNLSLDAKVVLIHLNSLGYRNITSEQLKEFMKDLKKLIKYDMKMEAQGFRVAAKTTVSSRSKSREKVKLPSSSEEEDYFIKRRFNGRRSRSAKSSERSDGKEVLPVAKEGQRLRSPSATKKPVERKKTVEKGTQMGKSSGSERSRSPQDKPVNTGRSTNSGERTKSPKKTDLAEIKKKIIDPDCESKENVPSVIEGNPRTGRQSARSNGSKGWIRPKKPQKPVHSDPVALYQYYKKEWEKFKPCFPGENSWTDLRWEIRNKLKNQK
ncbi:hypothetical protein ACFFRR_004383 [Megaselia abdita]